MNRRGFLKLVAAVPASAVLLPEVTRLNPILCETTDIGVLLPLAGDIFKYNPREYALGFLVSREMIEDSKFPVWWD